ncbi:STM3941 family protein [Streptomyces sp. NPDC056600]|uniref:STM3941 family protein n=1 Tax=Streptomyces sp. NPDC056600 TaxID=3345874 RepID=UPI003697BF0C
MINDGAPLPPTVYPIPKGRVWALLAGALAFVAVGVAFLVVHSSVKMTVAGALAVPFFGVCALIIAQRLVRDRPELVLDDSGVEHVRLGRFTWDEIAAVRVREQWVRNTSQQFIELVLHDPDAYLARAPRLVRSTASMNARLGYGPANMPMSTLPVPAEAVVDAMRRHHPGLATER